MKNNKVYVLTQGDFPMGAYSTLERAEEAQEILKQKHIKMGLSDLSFYSNITEFTLDE